MLWLYKSFGGHSHSFFLGYVRFVQSLSHVWLFVTPWTAARQASLSITNSGVCSNSCPSSRWSHPTISSSVVPFSSCLQSFPASGSFPTVRSSPMTGIAGSQGWDVFISSKYYRAVFQVELSSMIAIGYRLSSWLFKSNFKQNFKLSSSVAPAHFKCSITPCGSWGLFRQCRQCPSLSSESFLWCSKQTFSIFQNMKSSRTHENVFYRVRLTILSWDFYFSHIFVDMCIWSWCQM